MTALAGSTGSQDQLNNILYDNNKNIKTLITNDDDTQTNIKDINNILYNTNNSNLINNTIETINIKSLENVNSLTIESDKETVISSDLSLTNEITVNGTLTIADKATLTLSDIAKITVKSGGTFDLTGSASSDSDGSARALPIEDGAELVISGVFKSGTADFSDIHQLGTMTINAGAIVGITAGNNSVIYVGNSIDNGMFVTLTEGEIVSAPRNKTNFSQGYLYTLKRHCNS